MRNPYALIALLAALSLASPSVAHQTHGPNELGKVDFPISCSPEAQSEFERGLALLHHMMYEQAEMVFTAVAEANPGCAMAHWGIAMTLFQPLWAGQPSPAILEKGWTAIEHARTLDPGEREHAYIAAASAFYRDWQDASHGARLAAWAADQERVHRAYPDDPDALALHALAQLAVVPKDDKTFPGEQAAGALLEDLHARLPEHPAGFHYLIHAYDNPPLAERALEVARGYGQIAPDVPHALHMPSHIFVRLGLWEETIDWNKRSAAAAFRQPVDGATSTHYAHALDYLVYAHLQRGEEQIARSVIDSIHEPERYQDNFVVAYNLAAAQARYPLEREQWAEAAALAPRLPASLSWDRFPATEAISHFARGLGAARSGDPATAQGAMTTLDALHQQLLDTGQAYWAVLVDSQRNTIAAWIAYAEDRPEAALERMRTAADLEDSVDKHPVTPGAVLPARELLGDMLVLLGQPVAAIEAYEASLTISPGRFRSLHGAARAAELAGDSETAKAYQARLEALTATAGG